MTTTKPKTKSARPAAGKKEADAAAARVRSAAYEEALAAYAKALDLLRAGRHADAEAAFRAVAEANPDELSLAQRARSYAAVCARRMADAGPTPSSPEECYLHGVMLANRGAVEESLAFFDRALAARPEEPSYLYARACVRGLQGNAEAAASDLRKAVQLDAKLRFQAANDPDFERVRDEAVFIDVIEPSRAGA